MILKALERQTGSYGTVNAGDTVEVVDSIGEQLLAAGTFEAASAAETPATPEDVVDRNSSGLSDEPVHVDGTDRDILNTDGRKLHESGPDAVAEAAARAEAGIAPDVAPIEDAPISEGDTEKRKGSKK